MSEPQQTAHSMNPPIDEVEELEVDRSRRLRAPVGQRATRASSSAQPLSWPIEELERRAEERRRESN